MMHRVSGGRRPAPHRALFSLVGVALLATALFLSGCGGAAPEPTATLAPAVTAVSPTPTQAATATPAPTDTPTVVPTVTATAVPTDTPVPAPPNTPVSHAIATRPPTATSAPRRTPRPTNTAVPPAPPTDTPAPVVPTDTPAPPPEAPTDTPVPEAAPEDTQACYLFQNYINAELTVTFTNKAGTWNDTFKVPANGEYTYCLAPGSYTYTIDAPPPWNSINGELEAAAGDRYLWPISGG